MLITQAFHSQKEDKRHKSSISVQSLETEFIS